MLVFKRCFPTLSHNTHISSASNYLNCHLNAFLSNQVITTFQQLLKSHAFLITTGYADNVFVSSKLISLYSSFHKPNTSTRVFDSVFYKDTFLWNSIIKAHFFHGNYLKAFDFYVQMRSCNIPPSEFTVPMVVAVCAELLWVGEGKCVHGLVTKSGLFGRNSAIGSSFVYLYAKCGFMEYASLVFDEIAVRDVVSWTTLIIGYVQNGESEKGLVCLSRMYGTGGDGERVNARTLEGGMQGCGNLGALLEGMCLHGLAVKTGLMFSQAARTSVLSMYSKCGNVEGAYQSFREVADKDLFSWTSIIGVHARFGLMNDCLRLFWDMHAGGVHPDGIVISSMLFGFGNAMNVFEGKTFHGLIIRRNYVSDQVVINALLSMYCKFRLLTPAENIFRGLHKWDKGIWNTMIFCYYKLQKEQKCIELFREMQHLGIEADSNSLATVISSCSQIRATQLCQSLHCSAIKHFMDQDVSVATSLIDMYGKGGSLSTAWSIFCKTNRDIVTWNALISSYTQNGHFDEAIALFDELLLENLKPNSATLVIVLSACSQLASLEKGEMVHSYIKQRGFELNVSLITALIDMYAKCGHLEKSRALFDSMKERDTISWNAMISAYAMHGDVKSAIEIFNQMETSDVRPNEITFLSLLSGCAHAGLVKEGKKVFSRMQYYSVESSLKHYACMVDLLGKSGHLQEAEELVLSMPVCPDGAVWGTLLGACKIHNEIERGIRIAKQAIESDPENDGYYITISNMYDSNGQWEEAESARVMMAKKGVGKKAGWSVV